MTNPSIRMLPLVTEAMNDAQRAAAEALIAGPRKGVKGPFIVLLRSPQLMARLQKVGEYLRFENSLPGRLSEFATLVVSRDWSQQFEWAVHEPLALQAGVAMATVDALRNGQRPGVMAADEVLVFDFVTELTIRRGVSDATYREAVELLGEQGVVDLVGIVGYFTTMAMLLNIGHIPAQAGAKAEALPGFPC